VPLFAPQKWFNRIPAVTANLPPIKRGDRDDTPPFSWSLHWLLPEPCLPWYESFKEAEPFVRSYPTGTTFVDARCGRVLSD
jgi:hypothetical protein